MQLLPKVTDYRALAGGISLLLVGIHLSVMSGLYFSMDRHSFEVFHTGWWWEIALNLQIVCYFLMYLCHRERLRHKIRWRRMRARFRLLVALLGVSTPSFLLVTAAQKGWFASPPTHDAVVYYSVLFFSIWIATAYVLPLTISIMLRGKKMVYFSIGEESLKGMILYFSPFLFLIGLAVFEIPRGGKLHLMLWPFFAYLQGSLVYFWAAWLPRAETQRGLVADEINIGDD
ncbi:MAG: hypothetical protein AB3N28_10000 [Kordiimonas sp.]